MNITYDGLIEIATGRSRKETNWKNKEMMWSDLVEKLSQEHRTAESYNEYLTAKKLRQDEIKDIGGFVGGYLTGGRRKAGSVLHRQLLTLDIDHAKSDLWEDFALSYDCAAVVYSTHKHHPDAPRLRLIIPLNRIVEPDEYVAISRRIAGNMGIENFDHTTFEPSRLMYWPSTAKDGEFLFHSQDGEWLNADTVLATYRDWKDSSEWPMSQRNDNLIQRAIKKQGDPLEKPGVIGAFCRTFDIHEVIATFLGDVYDTCDMPGRYTYKEGSTSAGLVTYEDKYAFSHHGTDPISGKLCNAFDLVRLHKFGLKDEDAREGTGPNKLPSYLEMISFATKDPKVRMQLGSERLAEAKGDFTIEADPTEEVTTDWMEKLEVDRKGNYYSTINNMVLILENDPAFKDVVAYDEFESRAIAIKHLPWRKVHHKKRFLVDRDFDNMEHYLETVYNISSTKLEKALSVVYEKKLFHPVRSYLEALQWDGVPRIDSLLVDYLSADDSDYTRIVTRKTLVAAVARVMHPGIKFDYVLTLIGEQGKLKSTLLSKLGKEWFTDTFHLSMLQGKEGYEQLRGVWIVEIGEMAGMAKTELERLKGFISAREDRYRPAYGRMLENYPRQCIFIGTTNKSDFLRDQTGNRRFWPVQVTSEPAIRNPAKDLTDEEVNQVWAEAVRYYKKGETLYLTAEQEELATERQKDHTEEHPWTGIIQQYVETLLPECWSRMNHYERMNFLQGDDELLGDGTLKRDRVCVMEIWTEALKRRETIDDRNTTAIKNIMRNMPGWIETSDRIRYNSFGLHRRGWIRKNGVPIPVHEVFRVEQQNQN